MTAASSPPTVVVAVAGDPGGAAALAPVLLCLRRMGAEVRPLAYRQAVSLWASRGLAPIPLPEDAKAEMPWFEDASLLLTATSKNGIDWEPRFWKKARRQGIPSLVLLDFWSNYRGRFLLDGELIIPDRVAVMDETARLGLIKAGLPPAKLAVTGQPAFDALAALLPSQPGKRQWARTELGLAPADILVLFASQPLAALRSLPDFPVGPFDEHEAIDHLLAALAEVADCRDRQIHFAIRPHPREDKEVHLKRRAPPRVGISVISEGDGRHWALASDLVSGMHSVLLQEACYLERPVLSLQPGLDGDDLLPANSQGLSLLVTDPSRLPEAIDGLLFDTALRSEYASRQRAVRPSGEAAQQTANLAWTMLSKR